MRSSHLAFALSLLLGPVPAYPKAWQGINPGSSTQADVVNRFGEPSTKGRLEGHTALVYKGDQAIGGTKQAQFLAADDGTVTEINVFPSTQLDKDSVEGTYGHTPQKTFTDDFRPVWVYRSIGVMVFFGKDGFVEAIRFKPAENVAPPRAGASARAGGSAAPRAASPATPAPAQTPPPAKP